MTKEASEIIKELESKKVPEITLPKLEKGKIAGGFSYYILPDKELPLVKGIIYIKGGTVYDATSKDGLSSFATSLMRSGGTATLAPEDVDSTLDTIASSINIYANAEYLGASFISTSDRFDETLKILLDMLFQPRLDMTRFDLIKRQDKAAIKRRADQPNTLAAIGFSNLLYGEDNPWGSYTTTATLDGITIDDVRTFHSTYFHPDRMIVGIAGDVNSTHFLDILKKYKGYPKGPPPELKGPTANPSPKMGVHIIDKDRNQVVMNIGHEGSVRKNPDRFAIMVMNDLFGGAASLKTRLTNAIRVEKGLAYSVGSSYNFGPEGAPGTFKIYIATKTPSAYEAMGLTKTELEKMVNGEGLVEKDIRDTKNSILNKLVFGYGTAFDVISNVVQNNYLGYPDNYIEIYGKEIEKVTMDDVRGASKKYLHPDKLQYVLVGDKVKLEEILKDKVNYKEITIQE